MADFACPFCKVPLILSDVACLCRNCNRSYLLKDGYIDFLGDLEFYAGEVSRSDMGYLLNDIDAHGFDYGLQYFLTKHPDLKDYILDQRRTDWIYHCLNTNRRKCLDIGSGLGNITEQLSYLFDTAYSLEAVKERLEFQKRRYKKTGRTNIKLARGNALELPFEDNCFDLVVCNGLLEWTGIMNRKLSPRDAQLNFLNEVKRVLAKDGILYIGIENRFGLQYLLGAKDHSGVPYTSLMPRKLANAIVRQFGNKNGIYGDKSSEEKETGYYTYTYSFWGYNSLLEDVGFSSQIYWVFPSYNEPFYSGRIDNRIGIQGFTRYLKKLLSDRHPVSMRGNLEYGQIPWKYKIFLIAASLRLEKVLGHLLAMLFTPSFLIYCYKSEHNESIEDKIKQAAKLDNAIMVSRTNKIMFLLHDERAVARVIGFIKRGECDLQVQDIPIVDASSIHSRSNRNGIWLEYWIPGNAIDPFNLDQVSSAIDWLTHFQDSHSSDSLTSNSIQVEVSNIRRSLSKTPNKEMFEIWLQDYENYMSSLHLRRTAEHGDFWYGNIIINQNKLSVIDWEHFQQCGNPLFDFSFFIMTTYLAYKGNEPKISWEAIVNILKIKFKNYYGFTPNLHILLRYAVLRFAQRQIMEKKALDNNMTNALNTIADMKLTDT